MEGTSAQARYAASAAWLGMPAPPAEEFYGEPDDSALDRDIDDLVDWLYGPAGVIAPSVEGRLAA